MLGHWKQRYGQRPLFNCTHLQNWYDRFIACNMLDSLFVQY